MCALALAALDGVGRLQLHLGGDAEHALELGGELLFELVHGGRRVEDAGEELLTDLHLHLQRVEVVDAVHDEHITRCELGHRQHDALHLRGEHVDTADDEHIIRAPLDAPHAHTRAAAVAGARQQRAEVARAVAQHGHALLRERREHQLARLSGGQRFQRGGIDDLGIEMVLTDVRAVLHLAFVADARPHDLREAVDVVALQPQSLFYLPAHVLRPGLSAEGPHAQLDILLADAQLVHRLGQVEGVGWRACQPRDAEVADELQVLLRVARAGGDDRGAEVLHAIVCAQAAREQAVAVGHGEDVVARDAVGCQAARHALAPHADILARVAHDGGVTRGAAAGVHADDLALRRCLQAEGVVIAQVLFGGEGQLLDVLDGLYVIGADVQLLQLVAVEGHIMIHILHDLVETFALERAHLVAAHAFLVRVPNHVCFCVEIG